MRSLHPGRLTLAAGMHRRRRVGARRRCRVRRFPRFASAAALTAACDAGLATLLGRVRKLEKHPPDARWLAAWDDLNAAIEDASAPISLLEQRPSRQGDPRRGAGVQPALVRVRLDRSARTRRSTARCSEVQPRDAIEREFVKFAREGFEDSGVGAGAGRSRERAKQLSDRIAELRQAVRRAHPRRQRQGRRLPVDDLAGVAGDRLEGEAARRRRSGAARPRLPDPRSRCCERAEKASTRELLLRAKLNEGGEANLALLGRDRRGCAATTRASSACRPLPTSSCAGAWSRTAATTARFLERGAAPPSRRASCATSTSCATPRRATSARRLRRRSSSAGTSPTTPSGCGASATASTRRRSGRTSRPRRASRFVMRIAERMLGIRYTPVAAQPLARRTSAPSPSATRRPASRWRRSTSTSTRARASSTTPRSGRCAARRRATGACRRRRWSSTWTGKGLTLDELETLLHEMGHALHNNLSATRYAQQVERERAVGLRRGAVADARGLGLRQAGAEAVRRGLPGLPAGARRDDRARRASRATSARGVRIARQLLLRHLRPGALHRARRPSRWRSGAGWKARRRSATSPARGFRPASPHIAGGLCGGLLWLSLEPGGRPRPAHRVRATTGSIRSVGARYRRYGAGAGPAAAAARAGARVPRPRDELEGVLRRPARAEPAAQVDARALRLRSRRAASARRAPASHGPSAPSP